MHVSSEKGEKPTDTCNRSLNSGPGHSEVQRGCHRESRAEQTKSGGHMTAAAVYEQIQTSSDDNPLTPAS